MEKKLTPVVPGVTAGDYATWHMCKVVGVIYSNFNALPPPKVFREPLNFTTLADGVRVDSTTGFRDTI